jgi:hypothetical protein
MRVNHSRIFDDLPRFDRTIVEWIAVFEGPSVPHLQTGSPQSCVMIDTLEVPDAMAVDWLGSHEFPTRAFLNTPPYEEPASQRACRPAVALANRKFAESLVTQDGATMSNSAGNSLICAV